MRWLLRVAASAAVRGVVYVLVALLLAYAGIGRADAAVCGLETVVEAASSSGSSVVYPTRELAYQACMSKTGVDLFDLNYNMGIVRVTSCEFLSSQGAYQWVVTGTGERFNNTSSCVREASGTTNSRAYSTGWKFGTTCPAGSTWDDELKICSSDQCRNLLVSPTSPSYEGQWSCTRMEDGTGCAVLASLGAPGAPFDNYVAWRPVGTTCDPDNVECPAGYDFVPGVEGQYRSTCRKPVECPAGVPVDPITGLCTAPEVCPEGQEKAPDGTCRLARDMCPAGSVKGPDGSCVDDPNQCKAGTVKGEDGTCKKDEDGDGEPDDDGEHTATDSANCGNPPVCNGDQILCLHAKQLWRIDCNTRRNANVVLDRYCNTPPVCEQVVLGEGSNRSTGCTKQEEASLYLQWRQVCEAEKSNDALERIAENTKGGSGSCGPGTSDADCDGQPDWTQGAFDGLAQAGLSSDADGDAASAEDVVVEGPSVGADGLDMSGFGYGNTCPTIPDVSINGQVIHFDTSVFCNWLRLGGQFVLIAAALLSLSIMTKVNS